MHWLTRALIGAAIVYAIGWLLEWARRVLQGFIQGVLALVKEHNSIKAYAMGGDYGDLEVVEEIEVDEADLDEDVLRALERHGRIAQKVQV